MYIYLYKYYNFHNLIDHSFILKFFLSTYLYNNYLRLDKYINIKKEKKQVSSTLHNQ